MRKILSLLVLLFFFSSCSQAAYLSWDSMVDKCGDFFEISSRAIDSSTWILEDRPLAGASCFSKGGHSDTSLIVEVSCVWKILDKNRFYRVRKVTANGIPMPWVEAPQLIWICEASDPIGSIPILDSSATGTVFPIAPECR